jgi:hypothetical protein
VRKQGDDRGSDVRFSVREPVVSGIFSKASALPDRSMMVVHMSVGGQLGSSGFRLMGAGVRAQFDARILRGVLDLTGNGDGNRLIAEDATRLLERDGRRAVNAGIARIKSDLADHLIDLLA